MTHLSLPAPESGCHSVTDSLKSLNGCKNSSSLAARSLYSLLRLWVQAEFKAPGLHSESSWKWKKKKSGKCFWGETKTDWLTQNIKWEEFFFFGWKNPQQRHWLNQVVCYSQQEPDRAFHLAKYPTADDKYLTPFSRWSAHRNTDTVAGVKPPHPPPPPANHSTPITPSLVSSRRASASRSPCLISTMPISIHEPAKRSGIFLLPRTPAISCFPQYLRFWGTSQRRRRLPSARAARQKGGGRWDYVTPPGFSTADVQKWERKRTYRVLRNYPQRVQKNIE